MLYLEDKKVKITEDGLCIPAVKELYADDRHTDKPWFNKCITYIYWAYKKDGEYRNLVKRKRQMLAADHTGESFERFEENIAVIKVINLYIELQLSPVERLYEGIKADIDEMLERIRKIPFTKEIKVEMFVDVPVSELSNETVKKPIKQIVEMDNSEEKFKAINRADQLIDLEEKLRKKVIKEQQDKRDKQKRIFDE